VSLLKYEEQGHPSYEQIHRAAVTLLGMLGMHYPVKTRLPIFRIITKIDREYGGRPEAAEARKLLARLVLLRQRGLEPKHSNGQYT
jgi:hypothetical protein